MEATAARFDPRDAGWERRLRKSFAGQSYMKLLGARLERAEPGMVDITLAHRLELTQQHGYFHGGVTTSIADSAAGFAALTLVAQGYGVLTTELKINLLNPGRGDRLIARGRVVKPGRILTVCRADVFALAGDGGESHIATGLFTIMAVEGLPN